MANKPIAAGKSSFSLVDAEKIFTELGLSGDTVLLDCGCGRGAYSLEAARRLGPPGRIHAVDLWQEGIEYLSRAAKDADIDNIAASRADISRQIPVGNSQIDVCLLATVLHDLIQDGTDQGTLREVRRVVKPGGRLAVIEFKKIQGPPGPPIHIRISPEELDTILAAHGFTPIKKADIGPYNYLAVYAG